MAPIIFWISLALAAYVYIGYPLVLMAWRRRVRKRACKPALVANFADGRMGAVSGALILPDEHGREARDGAGATGAIYAVRRSLFTPLPAGDRAECEYRRKRRTLTGNYQLLAEMPELPLFRRNPIFVQLISHKVGRSLG
jgi:hypothetical protein